jgi:rubrerythrin
MVGFHIIKRSIPAKCNYMDLSESTTFQNLVAAFSGEAMANRKYLFFADVARKLGYTDIAKLFKETAEQETAHALAHFTLLHPELVVTDPAALSEQQKQAIVAQCLALAIEGETYEYTTMYPEFTEMAIEERDKVAAQEFQTHAAESAEHARTFRQAAHRFGLLAPVEHHHADRYTEALTVLKGGVATEKQATQKWICKQCSVIYDPVLGDPDSGIAPGTAFEDIPDDWHCPICGATKKLFTPHLEPIN